MVWSFFHWMKTSFFVDSYHSHPMPESGDVDVLTPLASPTFSPPRSSFADRRRISLKLDIASLRGQAPEEFHMRPKKCKLESMAFRSKDTAQKSMSPKELAEKLNGSASPGLLVLDCRSNPAYHLNHIRGAVHVNCADRWSRMKLQQGKVNVGDLVSDKEARDRYHTVHSREVVVYDEQTKDLQEIPSDNSLQAVLASLSKEGREAFVLRGGLKGFIHEHRDLCRSTVKRSLTPLYSPTTNAEGPSEPAIETATVSRILPTLYLGNARDAADLASLRQHNITYVLNTTAHLPLSFERHGIKYKRLPASDSCQQNLKQYFEEAIEFIDDAKQNGCNVLVHCQAGVSRSATITIAYILKHTRMTMSDAYKFVKGKRSIISPNFNFLGQLMEFEQDLNRGLTPRILYPKLQGIETVV